MATGISQAILANRVSYLFNFTGPSVSNDTACSSALVAIEQAVQALRAGACDLALAGGANLIWSPVKPLDIGIELLYAERTLEDGRTGDLRRLMISTRYNF